MNCPVCDNTLTTLTASGVSVDACAGGCGGIWFDRAELMRVDEADESAGESFLDIDRDPDARPDLGARLHCPHEPDVVMMRHFSSVKRAVTIDECPSCGGHWLDPGELAAIRTEYASDEERQRAAQRYFSDLFDPHLAAEHAASAEELARAQRFAHTLRFLCPSYYVPGKQEWGAF
jgi:Zn-finger nucleic acid-binding protein